MTNKICPVCKTQLLENVIFHNVEADFCGKCLGLWFERDELRQAKDDADKDLSWLDFNLWKEIKDFIISRDKKLCPACRLPLYEVNYGKSMVSVDLCNVCNGIWLDRGEFNKIMDYLKNEEVSEVLNEFSKNILAESWEVFAGPETLREEISDFLVLFKLLRYKFAVQYPGITKIISKLPK